MVCGVTDTESKRPLRVAYLITHPIQYQAPLLRAIAAEPDIDLTVFFQSDISLKPHTDAGFGVEIAWDVPLLDGYRSIILPANGPTDRISFARPRSRGLWDHLRRGAFDVLWIHGYARAYHLKAMVMARLLGIRVLIRDEATLISKRRTWRNHLFKWGLMLALRGLCDEFLAIGSLNRAYYRFYGVPDERIVTVPYVVDNDFFRQRATTARAERPALRQSLGLEDGSPVILFAAKMEPRKRPDHVLDAYARFCRSTPGPHPYLLLAGDGVLRASLEHRVADEGLSRVRFLGFQNQGRLPALFDLADVFVLPSVFEPWGLVVNEAMSAGTAVIISDAVGCGPDLVKEGVNGFVVPADDTDALVRALESVVAGGDPAVVRAMGQASQAIINAWGIEAAVQGLRRALFPSKPCP